MKFKIYIVSFLIHVSFDVFLRVLVMYHQILHLPKLVVAILVVEPTLDLNHTLGIGMTTGVYVTIYAVT